MGRGSWRGRRPCAAGSSSGDTSAGVGWHLLASGRGCATVVGSRLLVLRARPATRGAWRRAASGPRERPARGSRLTASTPAPASGLRARAARPIACASPGPGGVQDASRPRLDGSGERLGRSRAVDDLDSGHAVSMARGALSTLSTRGGPVRESNVRAAGPSGQCAGKRRSEEDMRRLLARTPPPAPDEPAFIEKSLDFSTSREA